MMWEKLEYCVGLLIFRVTLNLFYFHNVRNSSTKDDFTIFLVVKTQLCVRKTEIINLLLYSLKHQSVLNGESSIGIGTGTEKNDRLFGHHFTVLRNQIVTKLLKLNPESHFHISIPSLNLLNINMTLAGHWLIYMVSNLNIL